MSLRIFYSDGIEDLAEHLKGLLLTDRVKQDDPFIFSQVVVPNTNIAKWLQIRVFADSPALCMGVEFPFIEQSLFALLGEYFKPSSRPRLLPMNAYANGIMAILLRDGDQRLAPFRRYIAEGDAGPLQIDSRSKARMAWQLAVKLADLMDQYEVRREETIAKWLDESEAGKLTDPTEIAEAALAQKLFGKDGLFPSDGENLSLRQLFERAQAVAQSKDAKPVAPRKIYLFGLSTLSSLQVRILYWLAKTHEIIVYHNNVCLEYWGDIETKEERFRRLGRGNAEEQDLASDNPLLQQWGRAGRETLRLLVDLEEENGSAENPVEFEWEDISKGANRDGESVLEKVQLSVRKRASDIGRGKKQDASLQIVGAPGIRREVEMAYNAILGAVWKPAGSGDRPWSDCTFSDIAVLVPDMATYRPVIEAVFDARDQIPYGLIDSSASDSSVYLAGFRALMTLAREGLSRETVFGVLDNACVQNALGFTAKDVSEWRRYAKEIGAFDGFFGKEHCQNVSWERALARLRLGRVANERGDLPVWQGGGDSALKFSEIVEMLYRELSPLAAARLYCAPAGVPKNENPGGQNWADRLLRVTGAFLAAGRDEPLEATVGSQLSQTLYALDRIEGRQSLDFVAEAVEEFVGGIKCRHGGYLTHGVTIAGLHPMRPVPFKQVFVLGMGEGLFPGRDSETTLEIRGARRRLGDTRPSEVKKYLLLETLMATRERLVLSYPCQDIVKDAELFPSGMVCELKTFIEKNILPEAQTSEDGKFKEVKLPLLERGEPGDQLDENPVAPIRWNQEWFAGILPTYSNNERGIADRIDAQGNQTQAASADVPLQDNPSGGAKSAPDKLPRRTLTARELADFLESPLRAVLHRLHGINVEGYRDESIDSDAPLEIASGPLEWQFRRSVLEAVPDDPAATDIKGVYERFSNKGGVPQAGGLLGNYALKKAEADLLKDAGNLGALKSFVATFLSEGECKPDPVRTFSPARKGEDGKYERGERLFTGQTSGWIQSPDGAESRALVFNKCGDERGSKGDKQTKFPPKAVLEPFVTWMMMVAQKDDEKNYALRVGIADIKELMYNVWRWSITPKGAMTYLDGLADEYLRYLDSPDGDGLYLDFGYSGLADAIVTAKNREKISGDFPKTPEEWESLEFKGNDDFGKGKSSFDNDLVIGETMKVWSRMPGEEDSKKVTARFDKLLRLPMTGARDCPQGKAEEA